MVWYAVGPYIFATLALVDKKFVIEAVLKLAAKNMALLPDKL